PVVLDKSLIESQTSRDNKSCMSYTSKQKYPSKIRTRDPTIGDFFLFRWTTVTILSNFVSASTLFLWHLNLSIELNGFHTYLFCYLMKQSLLKYMLIDQCDGTLRGCSKPYTNQCPKPTRQHISHFAQQPGLQKDVVPVPFCNHCQKGKRLSSDYFQPEDFDTAGSAFSGGAAPVPLTPGPHFGTPGYRGPHVTTLYPYIPVPEDHAGPSLRNESKLLIDDY
ncbi:hypothetical protein MG293_001681, partial [Ovis ammon polii]